MTTQIIYFEGLNPLLVLPMNATYIKNGLIKNLEGNFQTHRYAWFDKEQTELPEGKNYSHRSQHGSKSSYRIGNQI